MVSIYKSRVKLLSHLDRAVEGQVPQRSLLRRLRILQRDFVGDLETLPRYHSIDRLYSAAGTFMIPSILASFSSQIGLMATATFWQ